MGVIRVDSREESWMRVNQVDNIYRGLMNGSDSGWQYRGLMNGSDSGWQYRGLMNGSDSGRQETGIMNVIDSGWWCTQRRHEWEHFRLALQRKSWIRWKPFQDKRLLGYCSLCVLIDPHWGSLISSVPCLVGLLLLLAFWSIFHKLNSHVLAHRNRSRDWERRKDGTTRPKIGRFLFLSFLNHSAWWQTNQEARKPTTMFRHTETERGGEWGEDRRTIQKTGKENKNQTQNKYKINTQGS